jgi:hypothetical protein
LVLKAAPAGGIFLVRKLYARELVCVARAALGQSLEGVVAGEGIFLTRGGELAVLTEQPYATEDVLQLALAEHPEVIAGPTTSDSKPGNLEPGSLVP